LGAESVALRTHGDVASSIHLPWGKSDLASSFWNEWIERGAAE
jgi:hypothetical protein